MPLKPSNEPWIVRDDLFHFVCFDLPPIVLVSALVNWRIGLLIFATSCWDLGWHQNQHAEHRARRHIHLPLRIVGGIMICCAIIVLHYWTR